MPDTLTAPGPAVRVAYYSMEIGLEPTMPTYSGGLGVLAGDTLKAAADVGVPALAVSLVHRSGYLRQLLDAEGRQSVEPERWAPEQRLSPVDARPSVVLEGRPVQLAAWRRDLRGVNGHVVPVYLLDADLPENHPADRVLTDRLYGGDDAYRLKQEAILGLGGVALVRALGHGGPLVHHMNEGHSALLTVALLAEQAGAAGLAGATEEHRQAVRRRCVFTTHTPVPAGHDQFPLDLVARVLGEEIAEALERQGCCLDGRLNLTHVGLEFSRFINGVAMRHGEVSRTLFPGYPIDSITNGVHAATWAAPSVARAFDAHLPLWRRNNSTLRHAVGIPLGVIAEAHRESKAELLRQVRERTGRELDPSALTLGFARRATAYKRADLLFRDLERLRAIARAHGGLQVVHAGKAHPDDEGGQELIRSIFQAARALGDDVPVVYLPGYDMTLGGLMTAGSDVWLNTPQKPHEASGTSGMKAALNGVPSLSVLDGWWVEGCIEGVTGWAIGDSGAGPTDEGDEVRSLLDKLEHAVLPAFAEGAERFAEIRRWAIALNGSHFHAQRMVHQYVQSAYELAFGASVAPPGA